MEHYTKSHDALFPFHPQLWLMGPFPCMPGSLNVFITILGQILQASLCVLVVQLL
jgi:hypothetical protein